MNECQDAEKKGTRIRQSSRCATEIQIATGLMHWVTSLYQLFQGFLQKGRTARGPIFVGKTCSVLFWMSTWWFHLVRFFFHKWAKVKITCSWYYVYHNCIYLNTHSVVKEQVQEWHIPAWCIETISIMKQSNLFSELTAMWNSHAADGWGQGKPGNWRRKKHAYIIIGNVWGSGCQLGDP